MCAVVFDRFTDYDLQINYTQMVRLLSCSLTSKCLLVVAAAGGHLEDYVLKILGFVFKYLIRIHLDS